MYGWASVCRLSTVAAVTAEIGAEQGCAILNKMLQGDASSYWQTFVGRPLPVRTHS